LLKADHIQIAERTREMGEAVQVAAPASAGWVVLRDVDARGAAHGILTLARTRSGPAHVTVKVPGTRGAWLTAATAHAPTLGGRHSWNDVAVEPGPAWDRLTTGVVDVRLVLAGAVRVGELLLA
jgi:beta-glucosidase